MSTYSYFVVEGRIHEGGIVMWYKNTKFAVEVHYSYIDTALREVAPIKEELLKLGVKNACFDIETRKRNGFLVLDGNVKYLENLENQIMDYLKRTEKVHFYWF